MCEKPRIKCAECPNRRFLPVTDDVIRWHLSGCDAEGQPFVAGVYPLLQDETCFFLAVDFDKAGWRDDAAAFLETCRHLNLPAALERSRSGRGAHVWFFFEEAIPAALARRLGSHVSPRQWRGVRTSVSIHATGCFRIKTRCRKEDLETSSLCRSRGRRANRTTRSFLIAPLFRGPTSGRFSRAFARSGGRRLNRSSRTLNDEAAFSACGYHHRMTEKQSLGPHLRHVEERLPSSVICQRRWNSSSAIRSTSQARAASRTSKPIASARCVSEPRVLQSAGDAAFDGQQATRHRVRRGSPASHRTAARLPR